MASTDIRCWLLLTILVNATSLTAQTPTVKELTAQKKTQKRYHLEQLAALKMHAINIKNGVEVVYHGWLAVENAKAGNFYLHRDFFSKHKNVNPHIANAAKVADIIAFQTYVIRDIGKVNAFCKTNAQFTAQEVRYVAEVYLNMLYLCNASLTELYTIIRPNRVEMTDDERLARIDDLHEDMLDKRHFTATFASDIYSIANARAHEKQQINQMQNLHQHPRP